MILLPFDLKLQSNKSIVVGMQSSIKQKMKDIVGKIKGNNPSSKAGGKKVEQKKEKVIVEKEKQIKNSFQLNHDELMEAEDLFNNPQFEEENNRGSERGRMEEAEMLRPILKESRMVPQQQDKRSKSVSFYEEGRPIYLVGEQRKWNDKIKNQKKGKFDPNEQRLLCDAVGQFLVTNGIEFDEFKNMVTEGSRSLLRKQKFFKLLSNVLPNRSPMSCYKYICREYHALNHRGPWTEDEVDQLLSLVDKYGRKWTMIGRQLNRTSDNVYDKFRSLGEEGFEERVTKAWKLGQIVALLSQIEYQSKAEFLDHQIKQVLASEEKHNEEEIKQLEKHKYNSKHFVFHNIDLIRSYVDTRKIKSVNLEQIRWKKVQNKIPSRSGFDCRNKFVQILQVLFKNNSDLDQVLISFLEKQHLQRQTDINWKKWKSEDYSPEQARNRLMILKKLIEGRSRKEFPIIIQAIRSKVNKSIEQKGLMHE